MCADHRNGRRKYLPRNGVHDQRRSRRSVYPSAQPHPGHQRMSLCISKVAQQVPDNHTERTRPHLHLRRRHCLPQDRVWPAAAAGSRQAVAGLHHLHGNVRYHPILDLQLLLYALRVRQSCHVPSADHRRRMRQQGVSQRHHLHSCTFLLLLEL